MNKSSLSSINENVFIVIPASFQIYEVQHSIDYFYILPQSQLQQAIFDVFHVKGKNFPRSNS